MNAVAAVRPPAWFWVVSALALVWNLIGLAMFYMQYTMTPDQAAQLPQDQRMLVEAMPAWVWAVDAVAVIAGTLGSLLLLMRKRSALLVLWISLVAVIVLFGYCLFPGRMLEVLGAAQALPMPLTVTAIAAFLVWFASKSINRAWIT